MGGKRRQSGSMRVCHIVTQEKGFCSTQFQCWNSDSSVAPSPRRIWPNGISFPNKRFDNTVIVIRVSNISSTLGEYWKQKVCWKVGFNVLLLTTVSVFCVFTFGPSISIRTYWSETKTKNDYFHVNDIKCDYENWDYNQQVFVKAAQQWNPEIICKHYLLFWFRCITTFYLSSPHAHYWHSMQRNHLNGEFSNGSLKHRCWWDQYKDELSSKGRETVLSCLIHRRSKVSIQND